MAQSVMSAGAVALMQGQGSNEAGAATGDGMLKGVCDIHLHCRPDSRERSADEFGFMQEAVRAGYRAVMFKSNDFSCHDRAYIIRQALPGAQCFGSVCMNRVHGDKVNVFAVQKAVQTSGGLCRCIWMPTLDAAYHCRCEGRATGGIAVVDDSGRVLPEVVRVMEICAEADIIFATGHASPQESIALARKAREVGVGKFVVTHAKLPLLDHDARPDKAVHRPRRLHRVLLSALPVGRGHRDAAIPAPGHRRVCSICWHRPVEELRLYRLGPGGHAPPGGGHARLHCQAAGRRRSPRRHRQAGAPQPGVAAGT